MQIRWLLLTVLCVALLAVGQMLFKSAAEQWRIDGWSWTSLRGFFSPPLLAALALYAVATVLWVFVLRTVPLSLAFPVYALTFIIVPLMAYFVWDEPVTYNTLLGGVVIMLGVIICTR
jgi:drug/metabolite transporter (DMT)-like permease